VTPLRRLRRWAGRLLGRSRQAAAAFEAADEPMLLTDASQHVLAANAAARSLIGEGDEPLPARLARHFADPDGALSRLGEAAMAGRAERIELERGADVGSGWIEV